MNIRRTVLSLAVSAALLAPGAHAASCNVTRLLYTPGSTFQVPCVQVGDPLVSATFKLLQTTPEHLWELQQVAPAAANPSGARARFSNDGRLDIPLAQLTDGSLWQGVVQYTGQLSTDGKHLFKLTQAPKLNALTDLGKLTIRLGKAPTLQTRAADKGNGNDAPQSITAAVLKVDHVELTGTDGGTMSLDVSGEVDLLKVIAGEPQLLGEVVLPANTHIGQLRLILAEGSYVTADGEQYPLKVPSGEQTGLKIHGDWGVTGGQITELQLDFSAEDIRFNKAQGYSIKPTVKVAGVVTAAGTEEDFDENKSFVLTVGDKFTLEVPEGAHPDPTTLSAQENSASGLSSVYEMGPDGTVFSSPSTVTIKYDPTKLEVGDVEENIRVVATIKINQLHKYALQPSDGKRVFGNFWGRLTS